MASKMELFAKIVSDFQQSTIITKAFVIIVDCLKFFEHSIQRFSCNFQSTLFFRALFNGSIFYKVVVLKHNKFPRKMSA